MSWVFMTVSTTTTTTSTTSSTTVPLLLCGLAPEPDGTCRLADASGAGKSSVSIKDKSPDTKEAMKWKWSVGLLTDVGGFLSPDLGTAIYRVCVYYGSGKLQALDLPPGGLVRDCGIKPCWKAAGTSGFKYKNKAASPEGITDAKFKAGTAGKSEVQIKTNGARGFYWS